MHRRFYGRQRTGRVQAVGEHFERSIADHRLDRWHNAAYLFHGHAAAGVAEGKGVDVEAFDGLARLGGVERRVVARGQVVDHGEVGGGAQALGRGDRRYQVVPAMQ
ncbi:hypothetical protein D3C79_950200 [compost metagenome]